MPPGPSARGGWRPLLGGGLMTSVEVWRRVKEQQEVVLKRRAER